MLQLEPGQLYNFFIFQSSELLTDNCRGKIREFSPMIWFVEASADELKTMQGFNRALLKSQYVLRCRFGKWRLLTPKGFKISFRLILLLDVQACVANNEVTTINSNKRILRIVKILRILKIVRLIKAVKVVECVFFRFKLTFLSFNLIIPVTEPLKTMLWYILDQPSSK